MTVEQRKSIDMMGRSRNAAEYILGISDHLDWSDPDKHLLALQEKINDYVAAVESGELAEKAPESKNCRIIICVYGKYPLPERALAMYSRARATIREADFELEFVLSPDD
jgi:hypothetical protein